VRIWLDYRANGLRIVAFSDILLQQRTPGLDGCWRVRVLVLAVPHTTPLREVTEMNGELNEEILHLRDGVLATCMLDEIIGSSAGICHVIGQVIKVAHSDASVLITGESGTGKELIARAIHRRSSRSRRPLICMNCAAIPPSLVAAELFGHEKGAFTGATQCRAGRFEAANQGTLFLDEVGEMPIEAQLALLRVLQERELERIGGSRVIPINVRIIAATNCNLRTATQSGGFRCDLFYRLNVFPIHLPPLRERREDILPLAKCFIMRYAAIVGKCFRSVDRRTAQFLEAYSWPGNIRELQNVIQRAVILCDTESFSVDDDWFRSELDPLPTLQRLRGQEKQIIEAALEDSHGRVSGQYGAAALLGVPRTTLESKIKRLAIDKYSYRFAAPLASSL
jgi:transcriptional regulator with GAF, ATPase, and Fis domain